MRVYGRFDLWKKHVQRARSVFTVYWLTVLWYVWDKADDVSCWLGIARWTVTTVNGAERSTAGTEKEFRVEDSSN